MTTALNAPEASAPSLRDRPLRTGLRRPSRPEGVRSKNPPLLASTVAHDDRRCVELVLDSRVGAVHEQLDHQVAAPVGRPLLEVARALLARSPDLVWLRTPISGAATEGPAELSAHLNRLERLARLVGAQVLVLDEDDGL